MTIEDLTFLLTHFDDSKRYIDDGYYRIRSSGYDEYELAYLVADACGTTAVHPQIKVKVEGERMIPQLLIDLGTSPTHYIHSTDETAAELAEALAKLVAKFYHAYDVSQKNN